MKYTFRYQIWGLEMIDAGCYQVAVNDNKVSSLPLPLIPFISFLRV